MKEKKTIIKQIRESDERDDTYSISCACTNCGYKGVGRFLRGYRANTGRCPHCECWTFSPKW